jgi:hydroxysqualene synthase
VTASKAGVETPSGKGAGDENFPVGSFLIARPLRPHVAAYYAFARAIDDIADNPELAPEEKLKRLDAMDRALCEDTADPELAKAQALRRSLLATGVDFAHARDLVSAFRQDAVKGRYDDWADLMGYCDRSAAPVGRFLLELHGEERRHFPYSDALCNALQVINHLQDCADDYRNLDRVYLPLQWLDEEGETVEALARPHASRGLRRVLDRCLAHTRRVDGASRPLARRAEEPAPCHGIGHHRRRRAQADRRTCPPRPPGRARRAHAHAVSRLWCAGCRGRVFRVKTVSQEELAEGEGEQHEDHEQHGEDGEQDLGDPRRAGRNAAQAEAAGDQRDDQKDDGPSEK